MIRPAARVKEILGWYGSDNPGTLTNPSRLMTHGDLAGTGRMVILPIDQGFERGPPTAHVEQTAARRVYETRRFRLRPRSENSPRYEPIPHANGPAEVPAMRTHDTRQIIIAFTAIVFTWSIACVLTIAFGGPLPSETSASADRPVAWRPAAVSHLEW